MRRSLFAKFTMADGKIHGFTPSRGNQNLPV